MNKVSIVIPNYNGLDILKKNLPSVLTLKQKYPQVEEIIVVDDASTDGSVNFIEKTFPKIKIIAKTKQSGFIDSVNLGVKNAIGDLILLLNTDVVPQYDLPPFLVRHFDNVQVFAVGCLDKSVEQGGVNLRGRGIGSFKRGFLIHQRGEIDKKNTLWVAGGSGMFRKKYWDKLGGLNRLYSPFYWEDIDLSYRGQKAGYLVLFEPQAVVVHQHETGSIKKHYQARTVTKISLRNQIIFVWLNISDINYLINHFCYLFIYLIKSILKFDTVFLLSFFTAIFMIPKVVIDRFANRKYWKVGDKKILESYQDEFIDTK